MERTAGGVWIPDAELVAELTAITGEPAATPPDVANATTFVAQLASPLFITDSTSQIAELWDAKVICVATALVELEPLVGLLEEVAHAGRPIVVVAPSITGPALALLAVNRLRGVAETCAVAAEPPIVAAIALHLGVVAGAITLAAAGSVRRAIASSQGLVLA